MGARFAEEYAILGIHALAGAQIVVEFNWRSQASSSDPDPLLYKIRPDYLSLSAGQTSIFLQRLTTTIEKPAGPYSANFVLSEFSQAVIPNEKDILSRRYAVPPARMSSSVLGSIEASKSELSPNKFPPRTKFPTWNLRAQIDVSDLSRQILRRDTY